MSKLVYSSKLREAIDQLRPEFQEISQGLESLTRRRAELAPAFMHAFKIWRRETHRPFIAFVHELDPNMPVNDRKAYRSHRSYRAALYLQHLAEKPEATAPRGRTPFAMLAITIKSFLPLYGKNQKDQEHALQILMAASKWRDRDIKRLVKAIRRVRPVGLPNVPRLIEAVKATKAAVIAFEREHAA